MQFFKKVEEYWRDVPLSHGVSLQSLALPKKSLTAKPSKASKDAVPPETARPQFSRSRRYHSSVNLSHSAKARLTLHGDIGIDNVPQSRTSAKNKVQFQSDAKPNFQRATSSQNVFSTTKMLSGGGDTLSRNSNTSTGHIRSSLPFGYRRYSGLISQSGIICVSQNDIPNCSHCGRKEILRCARSVVNIKGSDIINNSSFGDTNNSDIIEEEETERDENNIMKNDRRNNNSSSHRGGGSSVVHGKANNPWCKEGEESTNRLGTSKEHLLRKSLEIGGSSTTILSPQLSPDPCFDEKMRWKSGSSSNTSAEGMRSRPKSFDFSQRKAWMKYYRDMEVSSAVGNRSSVQQPSKSNSSKPPLTKGSINHLHLTNSESKEELTTSKNGSTHTVNGNPNPSELGSTATLLNRRSSPPDALASGIAPSSLFQRFSKTFSLRFGSNSNVNKASSSSPSQGLEEKDVGSKMRKGKSKSIRGEKCQSGDSGIGMEEHPNNANNRLRRIRSEFIEMPSHLETSSSSSRTSLTNCASTMSPAAPNANNPAATATSMMGKLSLVEIPNYVWEEKNEGRRLVMKQGPATSTSYEDILESQLDRVEDDGFSSGEDSRSSGAGSGSGKSNATTASTSSSGIGNDGSADIIESSRSGENYHQSYNNYHTLPHKNSRKSSTPKADSSAGINNSGVNAHVSPGRTRSLEGADPTPPAEEDRSIRGKVIREIVHTEQNYVKTLNDIVQGFLNPCRGRRDLFSGQTVRNIFSNVEDILILHARFLDAMKERINPTAISASHVGKIFTEWADHFDLYSEYCCNNPISMATVRNLLQDPQYAEFFEACRRLQLMDKLPLHGFLLRPIQRICQYHLQLTELLKHTEETHDDYKAVVEAVSTMKDVAMRINDRQRQFESLQEIIRVQNSIEGFEGLDLVGRNSSLLVRGELVKTVLGKRNKEIQCFLLNKDVILCKKDYIRKGGFVFDGRIDLDVGVWLNIDSNEEDEYFGMVHNSWRIFSHDLKTWVLFTAPTPLEKRKWIAALEKSVEASSPDVRMCEMAKLTTLLSAEESLQSQSNYHSQSSSSSNTLPKSKKNKKHASSAAGGSGKIDTDAMLIEVSKLRRPYSSGLERNKDRSSKFYV